MNTINNKLQSQEQLVRAREYGLSNPETGSLRSHGKLWGMDVFSWYKPTSFELENTLSSFPSPIFWLANQQDVLNLLTEGSTWKPNVELLCIYDKAGFNLPDELLSDIETILGSATVEDALSIFKSIHHNKGILLFTSSGETWKESKSSFESFLKINQHI